MKDNVLIVTRHEGLVEWLRLHGITGRVIAQATPEDVRDKIVYGVLPMNLAAEAEEVVNVDLPGLPLEKRGKDITPAEMDEYGAVLNHYIVLKVTR
jgi:putative CRISPR-associated protein (TIGR02620 family)